MKNLLVVALMACGSMALAEGTAPAAAPAPAAAKMSKAQATKACKKEGLKPKTDAFKECVHSKSM